MMIDAIATRVWNTPTKSVCVAHCASDYLCVLSDKDGVSTAQKNEDVQAAGRKENVRRSERRSSKNRDS